MEPLALLRLGFAGQRGSTASRTCLSRRGFHVASLSQSYKQNGLAPIHFRHKHYFASRRWVISHHGSWHMMLVPHDHGYIIMLHHRRMYLDPLYFVHLLCHPFYRGRNLAAADSAAADSGGRRWLLFPAAHALLRQETTSEYPPDLLLPHELTQPTAREVLLFRRCAP